MRSSQLVLLTSEFPYGKVSETFLETEIEVLAKRFARIYVLPSNRADGVRTMPGNAVLVEMDWLKEPSAAAEHLDVEPARALLAEHVPAGPTGHCHQSTFGACG